MRKLLLLCFLIVLCSGAYALNFEEARDAYYNASVDVAQLNHSGIPVQSLQDVLRDMNASLYGRDAKKLRETALLLNETEEGRVLAQKYFALLDEANRSGLNPGQNFSEVVEGAKQIEVLRAAAFEARELLAELHSEVGAADESLNLSQVHSSLGRADDAFASERFLEVAGWVNQTRTQLDDAQIVAARERALTRLARRNVRAYVQDHWRGLLVALACVVLVLFWLALELRAYFAMKKVRNLKEEVHSVKQLLVETQKAYYGGSLGRPSYQSRMNVYHQKERALHAQIGAWESLARKYRRVTVIQRFIK